MVLDEFPKEVTAVIKPHKTASESAYLVGYVKYTNIIIPQYIKRGLTADH